uniref:KIB1-4 beta-propeller domain-containing protein n=1 Tax=Oryza rufipogon TaxID=4529 RepID=A0A0E0QQV4_ORYRU
MEAARGDGGGAEGGDGQMAVVQQSLAVVGRAGDRVFVWVSFQDESENMLAHSTETNKKGQEYSTLLDPKFAPVLLFVDYNLDDTHDEVNSEDEDYSIEDEDEELDHEDDNSFDEDISDNDKDDDKLGEAANDICKGDYNENNEDAGTEESDDTDDQEEDVTIFFYSIARKELLCKRGDIFNCHSYWRTPQGWLLMVHLESHETFLWSPFTDQRINLPLDEDSFLTNNEVVCLLSHKPTYPNCVVLVVNCRNTSFWYCYPQGHTWFKHEYQSSMITTHENRRNVILTMKDLTAVGGRFCTYLSKEKAIVTLEFLPNPTFTTTPVKDASDPIYWYTTFTNCLLESCGELFMLSFKHPVVCAQKVVQIEVHKLDLSRRIWVKVNTIGNKAFLVECIGFGSSLTAEDVGLKRNCIYFVRPNDKGLYVYDMERGTTVMHNPGADLPDNMTLQIVGKKMLSHSIDSCKEDQEHLALLDPKLAPVLLLVAYRIIDTDDKGNTDDEYCPIDDEEEELDHGDENSHDEDIVDNDKDDCDLGDEDDNHTCERDYDGSDDAGTEESDDSDDQEEDDTLFFYSIAKRELLSKRVDEFGIHLYWITAQGWLLMVHLELYEIFLWSPITNQKINLPFDEDNFLANNNVVKCFLSHKPSDPNCIVLVVNCRDTMFWYCHPKGDVWFRHEYQSSMISTGEDRENVIATVKHLTAVGGRFHAYLNQDKAILTLEFLPKPTFTTTPVKDAPDPKSGGELFTLSFKHPIECVDKVMQIEVHKLNLSQRIWMKVSTIDNKAFLVDCTGFGASLNAEDVGLKRNCIYFVRPKDKGLYVYNMERGTTTIHNPGEDLPDNIALEIVMPPS